MSRKNKAVEFEEEGEEDDLTSIAPSEISDLDSDMHSLCSLQSCAESWIEEAEFKLPAEGWTRSLCLYALLLALYSTLRSLFISYDFAKAPPGLVNHDLVQIPIACVSVSSALALFSASLWSAANRRSRGLLLGSLLGLLLVYTAAATVMSLFLSKQPLETIGARAMAMSQSCPSRATTSELTTQCALAKGHQAQVADANSHLLWVGCVGVSVAAVILIGVGIWYTFELAFIEKKAAKHLRRHRRRKSQIPWHKIKITGPVTDCGGKKEVGKASVAKCPVMHS